MRCDLVSYKINNVSVYIRTVGPYESVCVYVYTHKLYINL